MLYEKQFHKRCTTLMSTFIYQLNQNKEYLLVITSFPVLSLQIAYVLIDCRCVSRALTCILIAIS